MTEKITHIGEGTDVYEMETPAGPQSDISPALAEYHAEKGATAAERLEATALHREYSRLGITDGGDDPKKTIEATDPAQRVLQRWAEIRDKADERGSIARQLKSAAETLRGESLKAKHAEILKKVEKELVADNAAGDQDCTAIEEAFADSLELSDDDIAWLHALTAGLPHLPVSFVASEFQRSRDMGSPTWRYFRSMVQKMVDHPKAHQVSYVPLLRDLLANDRNPDPTAVAREAREFAAFWRERLRAKAVDSMTRVEALAAMNAYFVDGSLGDIEVEKVRAAHIQHFLTWRKNYKPDGSKRTKPLHGRSVARDRAILHTMFDLADTWEFRSGNPVNRVKAEKYDQREYVILTGDELEKLLAECESDPMLYLWTLLWNETGARSQSEALWLRWEDVNKETNRLEIVSGRNDHRTKTGKSRRVPLTRRLREALADHEAAYRMAAYEGQRSPWIFHHLEDNRAGKAGERIRVLRNHLLRAAKRAGTPEGFVPHDLRHRRATTWIADGKSVVKVQRAMGHADIKTTLKYVHLVDSDLDDLVAAPKVLARAVR